MIITDQIERADMITHGGSFHADEVMGTAVLKRLYPDMALYRAKTAAEIPQDFTGIVYDIGGGKYDHHQKGGNGSREDGVPYASAGLLWREFGIEVMEKVGANNAPLGQKRIDKRLMEAIDAVDNGISMDYGKPQFSFSDMIADLNPAWNEERNFNERFLAAVESADKVLNRAIEKEVRLQEATELDGMLAAAKEGILVMDRYLPWKEYFDGTDCLDEIFFVIYPALRGGYNLQCVPPNGRPFDQKKPIPEEWRGKTKEEYDQMGLVGVAFVHINGFLAAVDTKENAVALGKRIMREN